MNETEDYERHPMDSEQVGPSGRVYSVPRYSVMRVNKVKLTKEQRLARRAELARARRKRLK